MCGVCKASATTHATRLQDQGLQAAHSLRMARWLLDAREARTERVRAGYAPLVHNHVAASFAACEVVRAMMPLPVGMSERTT